MTRAFHRNASQKLLCIVLLIGIAILALNAGADEKPAKGSRKAKASAEFFTELTIRTFKLEVSEAALNQLRQYTAP